MKNTKRLIFAERIKELRRQKGISQSELAKLCKLSKSSINMYERGEREPSLDMLSILGDIFNVDMNYLLGYQSQTPKSSPQIIYYHDGSDDVFINKGAGAKK